MQLWPLCLAPFLKSINTHVNTVFLYWRFSCGDCPHQNSGASWIDSLLFLLYLVGIVNLNNCLCLSHFWPWNLQLSSGFVLLKHMKMAGHSKLDITAAPFPPYRPFPSPRYPLSPVFDPGPFEMGPPGLLGVAVIQRYSAFLFFHLLLIG